MNKHLWTQRLRGCMTKLTPTEYIVLTMLATYTSHGGTGARPAASRLAEDSGVSVKTVRRALTALVEKKYLTVEREGGGRHKPTEYALVYDMPHIDEIVPGNVDTQDDHLCEPENVDNVDTQMTTFVIPPSEKRGHLEQETWTSETRNVDTQMTTDHVDHVRNQERAASAVTSPESTPPEPFTFADGTPLPPEPDPQPTIPALALVSEYVPNEIEQSSHRAPTVQIPNAVHTLMRYTLPSGIPRTVLNALGAQVARLVRDPNVDRVDIETALRAYGMRADAGPGLLPHLVADAARTRQGATTGRPTTNRPLNSDQRVNAGLELAAKYEQLERQEQLTTPQPRRLTR